jgi:hypothetical protein
MGQIHTLEEPIGFIGRLSASGSESKRRSAITRFGFVRPPLGPMDTDFVEMASARVTSDGEALPADVPAEHQQRLPLPSALEP